MPNPRLLFPLLVLFLPLGSPHLVGAKRTPKPVCAAGRFLLPAAEEPLVQGGASPDAVVLDDSGAKPTLAVASGCAPALARLRGTKRGTTLAARWKRCGALRKAQLAGRFDAGCGTLSLTFKAKGRKSRRVQATRSACGDRVIDGGGGEQCEPLGPGCSAGSFCAECRCVADVFVPDNAWGNEGDPLPPDATIVSPEELVRLARAGADVITPAKLASREAEERARVEADRRLVEAAIARDPRIGRGLDVTPPPGARSTAGGYEVDITTPSGVQTVVLNGPEYLMRETAAALRNFPTRANQELMYRLLFEALPPDQRDGLPDPADLGQFADEAITDLRAEVVRRADDALPNEGAPTLDGAAAGGLVMPQAAGDCTASFYGLRQQSTWPLEGYTTPVKNQAGRNTCAAHAIAAGFEAYLWKFKGQPVIDLSEQELYANAKGRWFFAPYAEGLPTPSVIETMDDVGFRLHSENAWYYNPSWERVEDDEAGTYSNSCVNYQHTCSDRNHQMGRSCSYSGGKTYCVWYTHPEWTGDTSTTHELRDSVSLWNGFEPQNSLQSVRAYLAAGYPVVFAFNVDKSFRDATKDDPWLTYPDYDDEGGHAVLMTGYKSGAFVGNIPVSAPQGYDGHFYIIKNSWGCGHGDAGYVYAHTDWVIEHAKNATAIVGSATSGLPSIGLAATKSLVTSGGSVTLGAAGNNLDDVEFYEGFTKIHTDISPPFQHTITYDASDNSTHYYFARGYDPVGDFVDSNVISVKVDIDDVPPTVSLTGPSVVAAPPGNAVFTALASDNKGVTKVEFFRRKLLPTLQGTAFETLVKLGEDGTPPYQFPLVFGVGDAGANSFRAVASDAAGNKGKSEPFTIDVVPLVKPLVFNFTATPSSLPVGGGQVTLAWSVVGANTVTLDNGVGNVTGLTSKTVNVTQSTTFTLTATNAQGSTTRTVGVNVLVPLKPAIQSFTATPNALPAGGGQVTLAWGVVGEDTLSIDQGVGDVTGLEQTTVNVATTTTFTLTAANTAGSSTKQVMVTVSAPSTTTTVPATTTSTTAAPTSTSTTPTSTSTTTTVIVGGIDLVPVAYSASASELVPGRPLTMSFSVRNQGSDPATGDWIDQLWLSTDGKIDNPGDLFLGNVSHTGPLVPNDTYTVTDHPISTIPATQPAGDYFLLLRADTTNVVTESNETNNDWPAPIPLTLVTPDLVPTSLTTAAPAVDAGVQTTVSFTVRNQGKGAAFGPWIDQLWLSTDGKIDNPGDTFLKNLTRSDPLDSDGSYAVTDLPITVPLVSAGQYVLLLRVDTTNVVFENGVEANNDYPVAVPMTVRVPDLTPTAFSAGATTIAAGGSTTVSFTVKNQGDGTARGTWIDQLWLSTDTTPGNPGDVFLKNVNRIGPLAPGEDYQATGETIMIPPGTQPGSYLLLLRANTTGQVFEAGRTANNDWPAPIPITVN